MVNTVDLSKYCMDVNLDDKTFKESIYEKRLELINIALKWEGSTPKNTLIVHNVWVYPKDSTYKVCFGKYGKEYYQANALARRNVDNALLTDSERKNCNDMQPSVYKDGVFVDSFRARFDDIFLLLEDCGRKGMNDVVRALSVLFFRNALLLDHKIVNGKYVYCPDPELVDFICQHVPEYEGVPMEVYIHALDAIGFNEDVKYFTQGKLKNGVGRENNMKTYCYAAVCVLGHENWSSFIYKLMRAYGVAPIPNKMFATYFPELGFKYNEPIKRGPKLKSEIITVKKFVEQYD